jgi:hypothetical protein
VNEERTGKCLRQVEHIRGHLWHRYSISQPSHGGDCKMFQSFPHSRIITGFVTRLTWWVPLVEQELLTLPEHLSSPPVFSGVHVTRSLQQPSIKEILIGTTSSGISYHLRYILHICRCCWNVATYKWKVQVITWNILQSPPWLGWLMEYLCHKWPRICSTCRKHFPVLSSFTNYYRVCN